MDNKKKDWLEIDFDSTTKTVYVVSSKGETISKKWDDMNEMEKMILRAVSRPDKCVVDSDCIPWDEYSMED